MSRYMLIMRSTPEAEKAMEEQNIDFNEIIESMGRYNEELIKAGVMLAGEGLTGPDEGFVVDFNSDPPVVTDGPYTEAKELFNGFWILDVSSKEEAKQWAQKCPLGTGVKLEVRRVSDTEEFRPGQPVDREGDPVAGRPRPEGGRPGEEGRRPLNSGVPGYPLQPDTWGGPSRSVTRSSLVVMTQVDASSLGRSSGELLRHPLHSGHLTVGALKRNKDKPVLFLGDTTLTGGQLAERISQYIQAFEALGAGTGAAVGLLSLNRPEVLMIIGAGQTQGYRRTALHPLGSLDDHAYVLNDAGITSLIIDPNPMFVERALGLLEKVPGLKQVLTIGPVPEALAGVAVDLNAEAAKYSPKPLVAADLPPDHIGGMAYTGGTTGKPKGVIGTVQSITTMTTIQLAEWEWPEHPKFLMCTPLSHAGAAFFVPTIVKGGEMVVLSKFDPAEVLRVIEEQKITATMLVPSMIYALMDHPDSHTRDLSSLETVYYGASAMNPVRLAEAIRRFGPIFAAVLRAVRGADGDHLPGQGRSRREAADVVRAADAVRAHGAARRGRQAGSAGRGRRDLRVRAAAVRRLLEPA